MLICVGNICKLYLISIRIYLHFMEYMINSLLSLFDEKSMSKVKLHFFLYVDFQCGPVITKRNMDKGVYCVVEPVRNQAVSIPDINYHTARKFAALAQRGTQLWS